MPHCAPNSRGPGKRQARVLPEVGGLWAVPLLLPGTAALCLLAHTWLVGPLERVKGGGWSALGRRWPRGPLGP